LSLSGLILFKPSRFEDKRGYFSESFRLSIFKEAIERDITFVQDNKSYSKSMGTIRGLHYQAPPHPQGKLVQCSRGSITDVAVDIRKGSPSFGRHICVELNERNGHQLWLPEGFLHGFVTREDHTVVQYKCTDYYDSDRDAAILWNDKDLAIDWGLKKLAPIASDKDVLSPTFAEFDSPFFYESAS